MSDSTSLLGQVILVTGAASGIGKQIALDLCSRGAKVAACDKNVQDLGEVAAGTSMEIFAVDFVNEDSIYSLVTDVEKRVGPLSAVVNCVGILGKNGDKIEDLDIADFDLVYQINLLG